MLALVLVAVGFLVIAAFFAFGLRRVTFDEARAEARLHEPGAHNVSYLVPTGEDATPVIAALHRAGYAVVGGMEHGQERVLVGCEERDRADVRRIIEDVEKTAYKGQGLPVHSHVIFEDEQA